MTNLGRDVMGQVNFVVLGSTVLSRPSRILWPVACTIVSNREFVSL
jgi:hypothetical protein